MQLRPDWGAFFILCFSPGFTCLLFLKTKAKLNAEVRKAIQINSKLSQLKALLDAAFLLSLGHQNLYYVRR